MSTDNKTAEAMREAVRKGILDAVEVIVIVVFGIFFLSIILGFIAEIVISPLLTP